VSRNEALRMVEHGDAMGSTYSVVLYGKAQAEMRAAIDAAFAEVARLDAMLSNYRAESEWSEVNRRATEEPVRVTPELFQLLVKCMAYSRESEGAFDIAVGPLMKLWGFYKGSGSLPTRDEVNSAMQNVGWRHVALDAESRTVRFDCAGVELDPGGIGKGYAVDCMVEILRRRGFTNALVTASDSTMVGMGAPPEEPRGWRRGLLEGRIALDFRQQREVFPRGGTRLQPHHGPTDGISGGGERIGLRDCAARHRQRGVGQAVLHPRARVDGEAQTGGVSRVLLRWADGWTVRVAGMIEVGVVKRTG
jgi:hypothetical protein